MMDYTLQTHTANANQIELLYSNMGGYIIADRILRRSLAITADEIDYNPSAIGYVRERFIHARQRIIWLLDTYFFPSSPCAMPRYYLLGGYGRQIIRLASDISNMEAHIGYWPEDYDASADWVWHNDGANYNEYKMTMALRGEEHRYTPEDYRIVCELFGLVRGCVDIT